MRGYFEIGVYHSKFEVNIGTLWRSAGQLGAAGLFTVGKRYEKQASDTNETWRHIPLRHFTTLDEWHTALPFSAPVIGIEMGGTPLEDFFHPPRAVYLLGAEDYGLPPSVRERCHRVVSLSSVNALSFNVAVAGSLVMYHRCFQQRRDRHVG